MEARSQLRHRPLLLLCTQALGFGTARQYVMRIAQTEVPLRRYPVGKRARIFIGAFAIDSPREGVENQTVGGCVTKWLAPSALPA